MADTIRNQIFFSDHLIFLLLFFVPFYWIYSGPETLFFLSALAFALGIFMIYKVAFERLGKKTFAILLALAFGFNRYIWGAFLHEFHPDFFAPAFFFLLFWSVYKKWNPGFWISLFFILITKEDYALYLVPASIYFIINSQTRKKGLLIFVMSIIYAFIAFKFILPYFYALAGKSGHYSYAGSWGNLGNGFGEIAKTVFTNPSIFLKNINYEPIFDLFTKFLFLPFAAPLTLIYILPPLLLNASCTFPLIRNLSIHYGLIPAIFAFLASIEGMRRIKREQLLHLILIFFVVISFPRFVFFIPQNEIKAVRELSLPNELVCAQSAVHPHLPVGSNISIYPECSTDSKFLLLNLKAETYPFSQSEFEKELQEITESKNWKLIKREGALRVFERQL